MSLIENAERMSAAELGPHQQAAWDGQRRHVMAHSPFLNALWQGTTPPEKLADLAALPFCDKAGLRLSQGAHPPFGDYLATGLETVNRLHRTSGTTGQAMNIALSARDAHMTAQVGGRSHRAAGLTPSHMVVHCLNYQMWMGGVSDHMTLEATGAAVVPFGTGSTDLLIRTIRETGITAISCTPSYPSVLEKVIRERHPGLDPRDLGLRLGLFGGEPGLDDPAFRARVEETWGMAARNANYGVSDVLSNFAAQCEHDTRLHFLASDILYPEIIDPESGAALAFEPGVEGELVLTHLMKECQPLVRFRTGDIIAVDETAPCACGRHGFRFRVVGRSDDMVVVRGLNMFPTMVAAVIGGFDALSGEYRIVLDTPPPYDHLPVQAEMKQGADVADRNTLARAVEDAIKRILGASARVEIVPPGHFPVTEGKTKRVIRSHA